MKTLLITNDFPPVVSGISTVFYHVWKHLPASDFKVLVPRVAQCREFDQASAVPVIRYPWLAHQSKAAKIVNQLVLFVYTFILATINRIGVIHCGQILSSGSLGLFFKITLRIPYCLWVYGDETKDVYRSGPVSRYIVDKILWNADRVITNSAYVTREFVEFGILPEKIVEVLPAVDPEIFRPAPVPQHLAERYDLLGKKVIMTVSRVVKRKGHELVVRALPQLHAVIPEIIYLIVGRGPEEERLSALAERLGVAKQVRFVGYVADAELPDYYNCCDLFVMPNREDPESTDSIEGFGIVFIEANACAKPVIGGRSGGVVDGAVIDGETGFLVNPDSVDELVEKTLRLLRDPVLAAGLAVSGRVRVERFFLWTDRARMIENLLRK
jgi:phosphatidylinositol alpha-1,6-mannosyltransferase